MHSRASIAASNRSAVGFVDGFFHCRWNTVTTVKKFNGVVPTSSGGGQTWTWTLPAHFPPGQCPRVTMSGGTLMQGQTTLGRP
jgi:hypothetical protein